MNENKPMNCIDWYEAFAFCAWDGGRLSTEAEWNYAAAAGGEQRQYPWSIPPSSITIDSSYAVYGSPSVSAVGSVSPKGDGKWAQADLAGSVWEWNMDWHEDSYANPCSDCAVVSQGSAVARALRGGSWDLGASFLLSSFHNAGVPTTQSYEVGARCARMP
jgi:formylglycine-generating enzyme required for sulfatase activity